MIGFFCDQRNGASHKRPWADPGSAQVPADMTGAGLTLTRPGKTRLKKKGKVKFTLPRYPAT